MVSDEKLIEDLQTFAAEIGETPTYKQMNKDGSWSATTYQNHFGSWGEALKEAGLDSVKEYETSKEQLIKDLQTFAAEIGETPTYKQMNEDGPWSATTYHNHFGSWNEALEETKLETNIEIGFPESKEKLIYDLQTFAVEIGETPTTKQMKENGPWAESTYRHYFGSWNEALEEAKLETNMEVAFAESKQQLIYDLQTFAAEIDETPTKRQMNENGPWTGHTYWEYFGSWNEAVKEAGLDPVEEYETSKEQLLKDLQAFAAEIGETPTRRQMRNDGPWGAKTYERHFGSWNESLKAAGLEPIQEYPIEPAWADGVDDYYGESWTQMRTKTVQRDNEQCRVCGDDELVHVHHITPRRCFEDPDDSNTLDNLITLCNSCHGRCEGRWTELKPDEFAERARALV